MSNNIFNEIELRILISAMQKHYNDMSLEKNKDLCTTIKIKLEAQLMKLHGKFD